MLSFQSCATYPDVRCSRHAGRPGPAGNQPGPGPHTQPAPRPDIQSVPQEGNSALTAAQADLGGSSIDHRTELPARDGGASAHWAQMADHAAQPR